MHRGKSDHIMSVKVLRKRVEMTLKFNQITHRDGEFWLSVDWIKGFRDTHLWECPWGANKEDKLRTTQRLDGGLTTEERKREESREQKQKRGPPCTLQPPGSHLLWCLPSQDGHDTCRPKSKQTHSPLSCFWVVFGLQHEKETWFSFILGKEDVFRVQNKVHFAGRKKPAFQPITFAAPFITSLIRF